MTFRGSQLKTHKIAKAPTGINGLDDILNGGLPRGRSTLVCGGAGSGKTFLGMEFLIRGAKSFQEPGLFVAFEETADDLRLNFSPLSENLDHLINEKLLAIDHIVLSPEDTVQVGEYTLDGLFIRLEHAIRKIGAKRLVLDTIELLFSTLDPVIVRAELNRLLRWLKERGITAVITAERVGDGFTRHNIEEFVSDCVILLDHRVENHVSNRRLRVVKYRGSAHGTNEYPFLIDEDGISVVPITSVKLDYAVSEDRVSTGISGLDAMLTGLGFYRGSTILVSGIAGTGKSSISASLIDAACRRGERALYFAYEESARQIIRNMRSIGIDLQEWVDAGLLQFHNARPSLLTLEMHLATINRAVENFDPQIVVIDPVTNFNSIGSLDESRSMITRLMDFLRGRQITTMMTNLSNANTADEFTDAHISSLMDSWLLLRNINTGGERNRIIEIVKSRGMAHSNQIGEFVITSGGISIIPAYTGPAGVYTGSARVAQEARDREDMLRREQEIERQTLAIRRKRMAIEGQIAALQAELEAEEEALRLMSAQIVAERTMRESDFEALARSRRNPSADHTETEQT